MFRFNSLVQAIVASTFVTFGAASTASAQVLFNAASCGPIASDDTQYDGLGIVVDNCVLSIAGSHRFASLTLRNRAQLTHPPVGSITAPPYPQIPDIGLELDIAGDMNIATGTSINLTGKGFAAVAGPGAGAANGSGGANGGVGGDGQGGGGGGQGYGSLSNPIDAGSGGGGGAQAGAGGGALHLTVGGALAINGTIRADGVAAVAGANRGGGAGGSILIRAFSVAGGGSVTALGGAGASFGGGGAGGRIAMFATSSTFANTSKIQAAGGSAAGGSGGAGTMFTNLFGAPLAELVIDNGSNRLTRSATTDFAGTQDLMVNLTVRNGARLSHPRGQILDLRIAGNATITSTASFDATGRGLSAEMSPEAGRGAGMGSSGAGYGGTGGGGGGTGYGSVEMPLAFGSGGGNPVAGGAGGGRVNLVVNGTLTVDGAIRSNGQDATGQLSGGGSGGSILVRAGTLLGGTTGAFSASGGSGQTFGGGGGGGRIAVYTGSSQFAGTLVACGNISTAQRRGGAGTIWQRESISSLGKLVIDNCGKDDGEFTEFVGSHQFTGDLLLQGGAKLSHPPMGRLVLSFAGSATIGPTASFDVSGRGFPAGAGPGAGVVGGGGGYGGVGGVSRGRDRLGDEGGATYGSAASPVDFGSGAGAGPGAGGGAVRLIVAGLLQIDGKLKADGASPDKTTTGRGGGSGGSIFVSAGVIAGGGIISAAGGEPSNYSGGGGGGRIALTSCMPSTFPILNVLAPGGGLTSEGPGAPGTVPTQIRFGPIDPNDSDCDGVADVADNCPNFANADQADSGGVSSASDLAGETPDGIGDACQCGDADGDGRVTSNDALVLTRCLGGLDACTTDGLAGLPGGAVKCGVGDPAGCDISDADLIQSAVLGLATLQQACPAASAPVMP